jgi:hypothetical protein
MPERTGRGGDRICQASTIDSLGQPDRHRILPPCVPPGRGRDSARHVLSQFAGAKLRRLRLVLRSRSLWVEAGICLARTPTMAEARSEGHRPQEGTPDTGETQAASRTAAGVVSVIWGKRIS